MNDPIIAQVIFQMFILLLTAKVLGMICNKINFPKVVGEFLAGIIWGPSFIKTIYPKLNSIVFPTQHEQTINTAMGLITLLGFLTMLTLSGTEMIKVDKSVNQKAILHTIINTIVSFVFGFGLLFLIPHDLLSNESSHFNIGFFLSICLMMSALPIISRVLNDWDIASKWNGQFLIVTSIFVDVLGWIILSIGIVIVTSTYSNSNLISVLLNLGLMILALCLLIVIGNKITNKINSKKLDFLFWPLFLGFIVYTYYIANINLYIGGLIFGLIAAKIPKYRMHLKRSLEGFSTEVFVPLFFATVGYHANVLIFKNIEITLFTLIFLLVGLVGKLIPTLILKVSKVKSSWREFWMITLCLNARGGMEIFVAVTGISLGVFNTNMYTVLVTSAVLTSVLCPIVMRWYMNESGQFKKMGKNNLQTTI